MKLQEFVTKEVEKLIEESNFRRSRDYVLNATIDFVNSADGKHYKIEASMEVEAPDDSVGFHGGTNTSIDRAISDDGSVIEGEEAIKALFDEESGDWSEINSALEKEFEKQADDGPDPEFDDYRNDYKVKAKEWGGIDEETSDSGLALASGNPLDGRSTKSAMNYIYKLYKQKDHGQRYKDTGWENISAIWKHFKDHNIDMSIVKAEYNPGGMTVDSTTPQWKKYLVEFIFKNKEGIPVKFPWVLTAHAAGTIEDNWSSYDLSFYPTGRVEKDEDAMFLSKQSEPVMEFIQEEILKIHKKTLLESKKNKIEKELKILKEGEISHSENWEFFPITIPVGSSDIKIFKNIIDQGIDSHLEGFTKSNFSQKENKIVLNFHNSELPILIRRLKEEYEKTGDEAYFMWAEDIERVSKEESV